MHPGAEYEHMRAAVLTASPHRSYWKRLWPMMPAMAVPVWMPTWHESVTPSSFMISSVLITSITCTIANASEQMASARSFGSTMRVGSGSPDATM